MTNALSSTDGIEDIVAGIPPDDMVMISTYTGNISWYNPIPSLPKTLVRGILYRAPMTLQMIENMVSSRAFDKKVGFFISLVCIGYGLDYDEKYRNLPFVGILSPKVYNK